MFDKLLEFLLGIWDDVMPFTIIKQYQEGVILRFGKYKKILHPGIHIKIPFFDDVMKQHTVITTINTPSQSLMTQDAKTIAIKSIVKYKVEDIKLFCLEIYDAVDAVSDVTQGIIKNIVMSSIWEECLSNELDNTITKKTRAAVKKFGVYIDSVTVTELTQTRTLKIINQGESISNG